MKLFSVFSVALLAAHALVVAGASVERYESQKPSHTSVIDLIDPRNERPAAVTVDVGQYEAEEDYYDDEEYEEETSGDDGLPRVAFSTKPKDPSKVLDAVTKDAQAPAKGTTKGRRKGKGRKRNPCLKKYQSFCIHGTCQYLKALRVPSCICHLGYTGERCHLFALPVGRDDEGGYNRTTALAVMAVVLSSLCLSVIGILIAIRYHKRGAYDVENEEKVKLGMAPQH